MTGYLVLGILIFSWLVATGRGVSVAARVCARRPSLGAAAKQGVLAGLGVVLLTVALYAAFVTVAWEHIPPEHVLDLTLGYIWLLPLMVGAVLVTILLLTFAGPVEAMAGRRDPGQPPVRCSACGSKTWTDRALCQSCGAALPAVETVQPLPEIRRRVRRRRRWVVGGAVGVPLVGALIAAVVIMLTRPWSPERLIQHYEAGRRDFSGVEMVENADLQSANLSGSNLSRGDLSEADLREADLRGADLSGARLTGADLRGANLGEANLTGAWLFGADLREADLSGLDLSGANLRQVNLAGGDLRGADLSEADLSWTHLNGAWLSGADLSGADLSGAWLEGADLSGADLSGVKLERAKVTDEQLAGAKSLEGATLPDGTVYK